VKVVVQLFAGARERAGTATAELEVSEGGTVADLRAALATRHPALAPLLARSRIAVAHEFADDFVVIPDGAEVALIPPVSGGAT